MGVKREGEEEKKNVLDKVVFEQFKHTGNEKGDTVCPCSSEEVEIPNKDNAKESRKRKEPFEGMPIPVLITWCQLLTLTLLLIADFRLYCGSSNYLY